jgi:anthranilate synthase/aminodeoxychorismate synthase-like glutamine amidotransferase
MRILLIDNYDSFTYILKHYLEQQGDEVSVRRNDDAFLLHAEIHHLFDALVLSPGPGRPETSGYLMPVLEKYIFTIPVLGICLGHQAIGTFFGASLVHAAQPMHGLKDELMHAPHFLFEGIPESFTAGRYHSLVLSKNHFPDALDIIATSSKGEIMALSHKTLPVYGIQFHPESCLTEEGKKITGNWLSQTAGYLKK